MKFSATLLKKLAPELKNKTQIMESLNLHAFEAEDGGGETVDISIPPNRFSDAASHWGIARELKALSGKLFAQPLPVKIAVFAKSVPVRLKEPALCPRASAQYFEVTVGPSPTWLKKILAECGLRSINNVVDITNYVMLEVGQPLHAFDYDRMEGGELIIRRARPREELVILDGKKFVLDRDVLVLADSKQALDVAGIKGGKKAEISSGTKRILLTACSFDAKSIYKTSRKLNLFTDASGRFSHGLSPLLVEQGMMRAAELLSELARAKAGMLVDVNTTKTSKILIPFEFEKLDALLGVWIPQEEAERYLRNLGFEITVVPSKKGKLSATPLTRAMTERHSIFITPPALRTDIESFEDIAEEVARLHGYQDIGSRPPRVHLLPSGFEDQVTLKDKIRRLLTLAGLTEIYGYSFISKTDADRFDFNGEFVELQNPISEEFLYMRPSLVPGLLAAVHKNSRFSPEIRLFEIGKIFYADKGVQELLDLGIAVASKKDPFRELKGLVEGFFKKIGLVEYFIAETSPKDWPARFTRRFIPSQALLKIESGKDIVGYMGQIKGDSVAVCELNVDILLRLISEEQEYRPLSRYPSVMRDISISLASGIRVGDLVEAMQAVDPSLIRDVDIMDEYKDSITLRVVFQADDRTLRDQEVNQRMEKIEALLRKQFQAGIR